MRIGRPSYIAAWSQAVGETRGEFVGTLAYDLADDPAEDRNRATEALGRRLDGLLHDALLAVDAPDDQLVRLGY